MVWLISSAIAVVVLSDTSTIHAFSTPPSLIHKRLSSAKLTSSKLSGPNSFISQLHSSVDDQIDDETQKKDAEVIAKFFESETSNLLGSTPVPYSKLTIGILKETYKGENRVSISPESASLLTKAGFNVVVEAGAGDKASFSDSQYLDVGAVVLPGDQVFTVSDIITKIRPPSESEIPKLAGKSLVGMISPAIETEL